MHLPGLFGIIALIVFLSPLVLDTGVFSYYDAISSIASIAIAMIAYDAANNWKKHERHKDSNELRDIHFKQLEFIELQIKESVILVRKINTNIIISKVILEDDGASTTEFITSEFMERLDNLHSVLEQTSVYCNDFRRVYSRIEPVNSGTVADSLKEELLSLFHRHSTKKHLYFDEIHNWIKINFGESNSTMGIARKSFSEEEIKIREAKALESIINISREIIEAFEQYKRIVNLKISGLEYQKSTS